MLKRKLGWGKPKGSKEPTPESTQVSNHSRKISSTRSLSSPSPSHPEYNVPFERPTLSSEVLLELRLACAQILQETGPTGEEYDEILNAPDPLERYHKEFNQQRHKDAVKVKEPSRPHKVPSHSNLPHKPINSARDFSNPDTRNATTTQNGPSSSAAAAVALSQRRKVPRGDNPVTVIPTTFEPLEPTHTRVSKYNRKPLANPANVGVGMHHREPSDPVLASIHRNLESRPKTSAAATVDYQQQETNRVKAGTGNTSYSPTPGLGSRIASHEQLNRIQQYSTEEEIEANMAAKAWIATELDRRRKDSIPLQHSKSDSDKGRAFGVGSIRRSESRQSNRDVPDRPSSRTGSIREGIRDYIRPRASLDSLRSRSNSVDESSSSRPGSRASHEQGGGGGKGWWRATGLRRKGSWASFRSNKNEDDDERDDARGRDRGPDLNRTLPPLPGLDQYKEKKEPKVHISQLMASQPRVSPVPAVPISMYSPALSGPQRIASPRVESKSSPKLSSQRSPRSDFSPVFSPAAAATSRSVGGRSPKPVAGTFQAFPSPRAATFVTADGVERPTTADDEQWRQVEIRRRIQEKGYVLGGYGESNRSKELLSPALQSRDRAGSAGRKLEKETIMKQRAKSNDDRPQKLEKTVKRSRLSRIFGSGDKTTTSTLTSVTGRAVAAN